MGKLILIRHGESRGNKNHIFLGHTDLDLTERGYRQAKLTADYIEKTYDIDVIYSSDLQRAYHTVEEYAKRKNLDIIKDRNLREIYAGAWEALPYEEIDAKYHDAYNTWHHDIGHAVCTDGESVAELQKRIVAEIFKIRNENPEKNILIGTHATPIRVLRDYLTGGSLAQMKDIPWVPNASVTVIDSDSMKLLTEGYADHLGEEFVAPSRKM